MRTWCFARIFLFFFSLSFLKASPYILEVTKKSIIFERPSGKSGRLAEADEGTMLLLVELSKQGRWLKVKDAEGTMGWVPRDRTDYDLVNKARQAVEDIEIEDNKAEKEYMAQVREFSKQMNSRKWKLRVAPLFRLINQELPETPSLGARVDLVYGSTPIRDGRKVALTRLGLSGSVPQKGAGYTGAFHYSWTMPAWGAFYYGPDVAYSFDKVSSLRHHLALSVAGGIQLGIFDLALKVGYDFFANSRAHGEVQLGCTF